MSYGVIQNQNGKYDLLEKNTEVVIKVNRSSDEAKSICRKLNLGTGFNGWTPPFFSQSFVDKR